MWHVWSCALLKCHDFNTIMSWLLCICCHLSVIYILALCYCFEAWTRDAKWGNKQYTLHRFITRYNLLFKTCISKDGIKTINFRRIIWYTEKMIVIWYSILSNDLHYIIGKFFPFDNKDTNQPVIRLGNLIDKLLKYCCDKCPTANYFKFLECFKNNCLFHMRSLHIIFHKNWVGRCICYVNANGKINVPDHATSLLICIL